MNGRLSSTVLMAQPAHFAANTETADSNVFQQAGSADPRVVQSEFEGVVTVLSMAGVCVDVLEGNREYPAPDEVFPNNWVSFHRDLMVLYPMLAESRRRERRPDDLIRFYPDHKIVDLTDLEYRNAILEGTGSLVLDPLTDTAFAALSPRTTIEGLHVWSHKLSKQTHAFRCEYRGMPIYHTNVLLAIGTTAVVWCPEVIYAEDRLALRSALQVSERPVVEITAAQMEAFCANTLELWDHAGLPFWAMSTRAHDALTTEQRQTLGRIVHAPIPTIETLGGGSVRCMLCQVD